MLLSEMLNIILSNYFFISFPYPFSIHLSVSPDQFLAQIQDHDLARVQDPEVDLAVDRVLVQEDEDTDQDRILLVEDLVHLQDIGRLVVVGIRLHRDDIHDHIQDHPEGAGEDFKFVGSTNVLEEQALRERERGVYQRV